MINLIQLIIILSAVVILVVGLSGRRTHVGRAWNKIGFGVLGLAMIVAVLFPETINSLAHIVGVGRGADLLLYGMTLAFIAFVLNTYLQQQDEKDALYRLARKIAVLDAVERYKVPKQ